MQAQIGAMKKRTALRVTEVGEVGVRAQTASGEQSSFTDLLAHHLFQPLLSMQRWKN